MVELAEILRRAGPAYRQAFGKRMLPSHRRAMADIVRCRTPALGGSLYECGDCRALDFAYHSCRNRHCPKCQLAQPRRWLEKLRTRLLPCRYDFLTFTLPAELRPLARSHQRRLYHLLLREAASSLRTLTDDPRWLGATPAILAVLHTWSRDLAYHPHVHLLVTHGGLDQGHQAWIHPPHRRFLVPGYALSRIFRARIRDGLRKDGLSHLVDPRVWRKPWTVHIQRAGDGQHAAEYLSRYLHRVAITNHRIEGFHNGSVTFRYTATRTNQQRRLTLPVAKFIARFLQHVLPKGFAKIRYYGLLSPNSRNLLEHARALLERKQRTSTAPPPIEPAAHKTNEKTEPPKPETRRRCPICQRGYLRLIQLHLTHLAARGPP